MNLVKLTGSGDDQTEVRFLDHRITLFQSAIDEYFEEICERAGQGVQIAFIQIYDDHDWD